MEYFLGPKFSGLTKKMTGIVNDRNSIIGN
jgi:hypothetical protein